MPMNRASACGRPLLPLRMRGVSSGRPTSLKVDEEATWSILTLAAATPGALARIKQDKCPTDPGPEFRIQMGWTPSATAEPASDRIGGAALLFNERSP